MNLDNLYISVTRNVLQVENKCRIHLYLTSDYDVLRNFNVPCAHGIKLSLIYVFYGINLVISAQVLIQQNGIHPHAVNYLKLRLHSVAIQQKKKTKKKEQRTKTKQNRKQKQKYNRLKVNIKAK